MNKLIASVAMVVAIGAAVPVYADSGPQDQIRQIMLQRDAELRADLLKEWLAPDSPSHRQHLDTLMVDLYAAEVRIEALGIDRKMIAAGVSLEEVPAAVFAEKADIEFDLWSPLAGRSFTVPAEVLK